MRTLGLVTLSVIFTLVLVNTTPNSQPQEPWYTCEILKYSLEEHDLTMDMAKEEHELWNQICEDVLTGKIKGN